MEYTTNHNISHQLAFAWWIPYVRRWRDKIINKVKSKYWERTHKYGLRIPKNMAEAIEIDRENGNTLWQDAIALEMKNVRVAFEAYDGDPQKLIDDGYELIRGHLIFDIKLGENFRRKA